MEKLDFYRHITLHNRQNNLVFWPWESSCSWLIFCISEWKLDLKPSLMALHILFFMFPSKMTPKSFFFKISFSFICGNFADYIANLLTYNSKNHKYFASYIPNEARSRLKCSCKILRQINELSFGIDPTGVL